MARPAPVSTYRLQINAAFDLHAAAAVVPYLHRLGVDWVYLSPILRAEPGSDHGYDVVDHSVVDPERGGPDGLVALSKAAHDLGMGVLVDIVPNHMGVATPHENAWWWDLLRRGQESAYALAFDVDWAAGDGRLVVPVVGDDDLLADGGIDHLTVVGTGDESELRYHDNRYPVAPGTASLGDAQAVHAAQHYRLVHWKVADAGLNYRRFFAVNTLAGIRVEEPSVFEESHREIRRWFDEGLVDGLRVDHPDGVRFPEAYLSDLSELTGGAYVLVEKILEPGEELPTSWATAGTTGYDALGLLDRVLTDPGGQAALDTLAAELNAPVDYEELVHATKRAVADGILHSEVLRISRELAAAGVDHDADRVADAVGELLTVFAVYRSYLPQGRGHLDEALATAAANRPDLVTALDAVAPVLGDPEAPAAQRFQQTSGMVMAKGVEDCAFYRYTRLTSLDEVGGDPSVFALTLADFHEAMSVRQEQWPTAMTTLTTHDTKRGEDVRARIGVLAEVPEAWAAALRRLLDLAPLPDAGFANLLWQAVVGAWPARDGGSLTPGDLRERLHAYAEKAMREAGDRTQWTSPDEDYESAVHRAVDAAFDDPEVAAVVAGLVEELADPGWSNALAAKLVALTMPGVPDVYQGSELWEQSLVDPDNRRPVDFPARVSVLDGLQEGAEPALGSGPDASAEVKLLLTRAALGLRRHHPELFTGYAPVAAGGAAAEHVLAFDRGGVITVATRLPAGLATGQGWGDTALMLPPGRWVDVLTGTVVEPLGSTQDPAGPLDAADETSGGVPVAELLATYPVALLARFEEDA